jgi:hypothetical protein
MLRHSTFDKYYKSIVAKHDAKMAAQLRKQIEAGIDNYKSSGAIGQLPTDGINDAITELFTDAAVMWGRYVQKTLPKVEEKKSEGLDQFIRIVKKFFSYYFMDRSVTQITETTRAFMLQVINDGIDNGLGEDEIVRNLRESNLTNARARLITRTETGRAMNTGAMLSAATSRVVMDKVWISAQDNRTRRLPRDNYDHLHMKGKQVPYDGVFIVPSTQSIDLMSYPGDSAGSAGNVCNCRCTVAFVPKRDASGNLQLVDLNNPTQRNNIYRSIVLNNS